MHNIKSFLLLILISIFGLSACSLLQGEQPEAEPTLSLNGSTIVFNGNTSKHNASLLTALINKHAGSITTLQVTSGGGNVLGGLEIGNAVHQHQLNVVVHKYCLSSCSNYIVTAAKQVFVQNSALIGWHGSSLQALYSSFESDISIFSKFLMLLSGIDWEQENEKYLKNWHKQEAAFFEKVNVEHLITVIGMMPGFKEQRNADFYSYDIQTLQSLGLTIEFEDQQLEANKNGDQYVQIFNIDHGTLNSLRTELNRTLRETTVFSD